MLSDKALAYFNAKVRAIAERLVLPSTAADIDIQRDPNSDCTGFIQFYDKYDLPQAELVVDEFNKDTHLAGEGMWGDEYAMGLGEEEWDGCETQYYFDANVIDFPEFIDASDFEREAWRSANLFWPSHPDRQTQNVFMPLKYGYYDDIAAGRKTVECRKYTQTWANKLLTNNLRHLTFQRGYAKGAAKITYEIVKIEIADADGRHRYQPEEIPDFSSPEWILVHLGKRVY